MEKHIALKKPCFRFLALCTIYLLNVCDVTSFYAPNSVERRYGGVLKRQKHIPSMPKMESIEVKYVETAIDKEGTDGNKICNDKRGISRVENGSTLESTKVKAILQNMSLLSVLVIPSSATEMFKKRSVLLIASFFLFSVALFTDRVRHFLYPGSSKDESFQEPLPPGKLIRCCNLLDFC